MLFIKEIITKKVFKQKKIRVKLKNINPKTYDKGFYIYEDNKLQTYLIFFFFFLKNI